ncbi:MAG: hypothetical protein M0C28_02310 [Candidatus Moduliflexus flocculans]|nr:hypothetical protein [Candidatus Moduliflexus flocculans]
MRWNPGVGQGINARVITAGKRSSDGTPIKFGVEARKVLDVFAGPRRWASVPSGCTSTSARAGSARTSAWSGRPSTSWSARPGRSKRPGSPWSSSISAAASGPATTSRGASSRSRTTSPTSPAPSPGPAFRSRPWPSSRASTWSRTPACCSSASSTSRRATATSSPASTEGPSTPCPGRPSTSPAHHEIVNAGRVDGPHKARITVAGNLCETGDVFGRERSMPLPESGDVLAVLCAGAYCRSMASNFNLREIPREVLI